MVAGYFERICSIINKSDIPLKIDSEKTKKVDVFNSDNSLYIQGKLDFRYICYIVFKDEESLDKEEIINYFNKLEKRINQEFKIKPKIRLETFKDLNIFEYETMYDINVGKNVVRTYNKGGLEREVTIPRFDRIYIGFHIPYPPI